PRGEGRLVLGPVDSGKAEHGRADAGLLADPGRVLIEGHGAELARLDVRESPIDRDAQRHARLVETDAMVIARRAQAASQHGARYVRDDGFRAVAAVDPEE